MTPEIKFAFIAACFAVAVLSFFRCNCKKDWAWLVGGLAFTLGADYFLVLQNNHVSGVAVFLFAHVCYIERAMNAMKQKIKPVTKRLGIVAIALIFLFVLHTGSVVIGLAIGYAVLFVSNLVVNFRHLTCRETRIPKLNRALTCAGLVLFALCDICVMLFNLPQYFGAYHGLTAVFPLIWVFYLPSQIILAVTAVRFSREKMSIAELQ